MRVLLVDDHAVVRAGVCAFFQSYRPHWEIVGEADNGDVGAREAERLKPDLIMMDYRMPVMDGVEATRIIRRRVPTAEIVMLTFLHDASLLRDALLVGAHGFVLKSDARSLIVHAAESVVRRRPYISPTLSWCLMDMTVTKPDLTSRERRIVHLIAEGNSNRKMADMLSISCKTVESHRAAVMRKLSCENQAALIRYAIRNNLVEA